MWKYSPKPNIVNKPSFPKIREFLVTHHSHWNWCNSWNLCSLKGEMKSSTAQMWLLGYRLWCQSGGNDFLIGLCLKCEILNTVISSGKQERICTEIKVESFTDIFSWFYKVIPWAWKAHVRGNHKRTGEQKVSTIACFYALAHLAQGSKALMKTRG